MKQLLLIFTILPFLAVGQDCDCASTFQWTKTTFEDNDAGFQYILDKKGNQAYKLHNQVFDKKLKSINTPNECQAFINEWLQFFRKGHIGLIYIGEKNSNQDESSANKANNPHKDWETYAVEEGKFKRYLDEKTMHDFEGIWETGAYQIGIKKEGDNFIGFIINSGASEWTKNQVKLKITETENGLVSVFYMRDRSPAKSENIASLGSNFLQIGDINLKRIYPKIKEDLPYQLHFKALDAALPFLEQYNETTLYFRIPSFSGTPEKIAIDSVIALHREQILSTENLIIDIRYGTGGSDFGFFEILPLLYTNPIRTPAMEFRSTPLNNQRMLDMSNNEGIALEYNLQFSEEERKKYKTDYEILSKHIGEFVNLDSTSVSLTTYDTIYPYPQNVGIIHNHANGSTDEQFLLAAKQSKKVKLFGKPTQGALDVANMNKTTSPCGDYILWYTLSKSYRIPEFPVDDIGIQPDYYIDAEIPEYEWIDFVAKILNE